jgi:hypothetical protein
MRPPRYSQLWEGRRGDHPAGAAVLIDSDLIAGSPCDRRRVGSKAASRYVGSGKGCERPTATAPSGYIRKDAYPPCAGDVVLILVAVGIVDKEGAGGVVMALRSAVVRRGMRRPR